MKEENKEIVLLNFYYPYLINKLIIIIYNVFL